MVKNKGCVLTIHMCFWFSWLSQYVCCSSTQGLNLKMYTMRKGKVAIITSIEFMKYSVHLYNAAWASVKFNLGLEFPNVRAG